jgi:hypothetical protein
VQGKLKVKVRYVPLRLPTMPTMPWEPKEPKEPKAKEKRVSAIEGVEWDTLGQRVSVCRPPILTRFMPVNSRVFTRTPAHPSAR